MVATHRNKFTLAPVKPSAGLHSVGSASSFGLVDFFFFAAINSNVRRLSFQQSKVLIRFDWRRTDADGACNERDCNECSVSSVDGWHEWWCFTYIRDRIRSTCVFGSNVNHGRALSRNALRGRCLQAVKPGVEGGNTTLPRGWNPPRACHNNWYHRRGPRPLRCDGRCGHHIEHRYRAGESPVHRQCATA